MKANYGQCPFFTTVNLCAFVCVKVYMSVISCLPPCLSVQLPLSVSPTGSDCLSTFISVCLAGYMSLLICLFVRLRMPVSRSDCIYVPRCTCQCTCLSVSSARDAESTVSELASTLSCLIVDARLSSCGRKKKN